MSIQNEVLTAIASRRSCRAYKPEQITAEELNAVTAAGTWAPTAMGRQSPVMVAVQDKETLTELSRLNAAVMGTQNDPFYGAPTAVLVLCDKTNPNGVQDASLVMGNLMNAAHALGVGSCWIQGRLRTAAGRSARRRCGAFCAYRLLHKTIRRSFWRRLSGTDYNCPCSFQERPFISE